MGRFAGGAASTLPISGLTGVIALVGAAGVAVGLGVFTVDAEANPATGNPITSSRASKHSLSAAAIKARHRHAKDEISRSVIRPSAATVQREMKTKHLPVSKQDVAGTLTRTVAPTDPRDIAQSMLASYGWGDQYSCLNSLWVSESDWNPHATNSYSGAYGIPQALPAEKMASAGPDWRNNAATQIKWGLEYIRLSYGSPCSAWSFKQGNNWY